MEGGRGGHTWERSRESLRLLARGSPTCTGEGRGQRPRSALVMWAAAAFLGRSPRRPRLRGKPAPGGRGAGQRRIRALRCSPRRRREEPPSAPPLLPERPRPGAGTSEPETRNGPLVAPRCGEPTGAPRQCPPTCRERQLCQPVARRALRLAPPIYGS